MGRLTLAWGLLGLGCTALIVVMQADSVSPLLALPVLALAVAAAAPRLGAAAMCVWCCVAAASVGLFMVPCAVGMLASVRRSA